MATRNITVTLKVRQDTAANWASKNSVLSAGEFGYDTTNKVLKIGDGTTAWANLVALKPRAAARQSQFMPQRRRSRKKPSDIRAAAKLTPNLRKLKRGLPHSKEVIKL